MTSREVRRRGVPHAVLPASGDGTRTGESPQPTTGLETRSLRRMKDQFDPASCLRRGEAVPMVHPSRSSAIEPRGQPS